MENKRKTGLALLMSFLLLYVWSSCTSEDQLHSQTSADVETTFGLKSSTAMNGKITIRDVYVKLDHIQATGNLGGNNNTDITQPVPPEEPPFQLSKSDSNKINFTLPFRSYDRLDFHLFLFQDTYELVYQESPVAESPDTTEDHDGGSPDGGEQQENEDDNNEDNGNDSENDGEDDGDDDSNNSGDNDQEDDEDDDQDDSESSEDDDENDDENDDDKKDNDKKNEDKDGDKGNDEGDDDEDDDDEDDDDEDSEDGDDDGRTGNAGRQIANLADFFQNAKPGMVVMGTYENNGRIINIIFVAAGIEQITLPARQNDSFSIRLDEKNAATISFDPEVLFDGLAPADIESAQIQNYQQQQVLFIHPDFNSNLFQVLAPRLEQSADLNFAVKNL